MQRTKEISKGSKTMKVAVTYGILNDHITKSEIKPERPKSARPESRRQRVSNYTYIDEGTEQRTNRPKSARPASRWERRKSFDNVPSDDEKSLSEQDLSDWPSSQINRPHEAETGSKSQSRSVIRHDRQRHLDESHTIKDSSVPATLTNSKSGNKDVANYCPESINDRFSDMSIFSRSQRESERMHEMNGKCTYVDKRKQKQAVYPRTTSNNVDDVFNGINGDMEDNYSNIDPVLYFNDICASQVRKPSLSKDAIKLIANEKFSRQSQMVIGYPGNYQYKYQLPRTTASCHGNRELCHETQISGSRRALLFNGYHTALKNESLANTSRDRLLKHEEELFRKRDADTEMYSSGNILTSTRQYRKKLDDVINTVVACQQKGINEITTRKPRKLAPISSISNKPT